MYFWCERFLILLKIRFVKKKKKWLTTILVDFNLDLNVLLVNKIIIRKKILI